MRSPIAVAAVAAVALGAGPAIAQPSPCGATSGARVDVSGSGADMTELARLLRADLAPRDIALCPAGDGPSPAIATVSVSARADGASIDVEVRDRLTAKRVSREVDLAGVPPDGRALLLAVVTDELLRASWAELALATSPPPSEPVPEGVRETVDEGLSTAPRAVTLHLDATVEAETWAGSLSLYGADLRVGLETASGFGATLRAGGRGASAATGPDGQVQTTAVLAGLGASYRAVPAGRSFGLEAIVRADVARIAFAAAANTGAAGLARADTTILVGAGVDAWLRLTGSAHLVAEALVDTPLRAVTAEDAGRAVVAASGAGVEGGAGIRVAF